MSAWGAWMSLATDYELRVLESILRYQLGIEIKLDDIKARLTVVRSRKTGRIKQVLIDGKLFATIRASDGFIILSKEGWRTVIELAQGGSLPCVTVPDDVATFVADGRTLFSKHVVASDGEILPGDEVCVKSERGEVVGAGRAMLPGWEMGRTKRGKAVKTR